MDRSAGKGDRLSRIFAGSDDDVTLSLMRAVPYHLTPGSELDFNLPSQAAKIFANPLNDLPKTDSDWMYRLSSEDKRTRQKAMRQLSWDGAEYKCIYQWRSLDGNQIWVEEHGRRISGEGDRPTRIEGVMRNVTSRKIAQDRAQFLANHDGLTGLANAESLKRTLDHLAALTQRQRSDGALLRLRLTNIQDVNDIYGYEIGDRLLKDVANRLSEIGRAPDVVGRIGGADFALILYGASKEDVQAVTDRLFILIDQTPIKTPYGVLRAEISIGSTQMRIQAGSADEALSQSRIATDNAGASQLCQYEDSMAMDESRSARETTAQDILAAVNEHRIQLAYQPIIEAKTSRLHHYECLLRLRREDGEVISAGRFIMAAERLGLVAVLDKRALELATETLRQDPDIQLALNVSAGTVKDEDASSDYIETLKALGPLAKNITLELTETLALDDPALASAFSNSARTLGCHFAIDDFGSGYTTFQNLMAIEADTIKIDGTLIEGIATDMNMQTFVRMMVDLAQTFGVETVAEMVDNRADALVLRRLGIDYLQGFMFGIPSAAPSWQKRAS